MKYITAIILLVISLKTLANDSYVFCDSIAVSAQKIMMQRLNGDYSKIMFEKIDLQEHGYDKSERLKLIITRAFQIKYNGSYSNKKALSDEFKSQEFILCIQSHGLSTQPETL